MSDFERSYLGQLRTLVGSRVVLMPGARCVLERDDGTILLHRRGDNGLWALPGGGAEVGQSVTEVIVREMTEETGLTPLDPVAWGHSSDPEHEHVTYPNGDRVHPFAMNFRATRWTGTLHADGEETLALGWFHPDDLPDDFTAQHRRALRFWRVYHDTGRFQVF